jgi:hypothetical protein
MEYYEFLVQREQATHIIRLKEIEIERLSALFKTIDVIKDPYFFKKIEITIDQEKNCLKLLELNYKQLMELAPPAPAPAPGRETFEAISKELMTKENLELANEILTKAGMPTMESVQSSVIDLFDAMDADGHTERVKK